MEDNKTEKTVRGNRERYAMDNRTPFAIAAGAGIMAAGIILTTGFEYATSYVFLGLSLISLSIGIAQRYSRKSNNQQ